MEKPPANAIDWGSVLAQHGGWLRRVVVARLGERQAVDEVLQEVALAAVKQQAPVSDRQKLPGWLYRLAVRAVLLYRRKCGRQRRLVERYALRQPNGDASATPVDWLLADERRVTVQRALALLPARDREVLLLKYVENWNCREIADHLGLSVCAIETRLHRARLRLRATLENREDDHGQS